MLLVKVGLVSHGAPPKSLAPLPTLAARAWAWRRSPSARAPWAGRAARRPAARAGPCNGSRSRRYRPRTRALAKGEQRARLRPVRAARASFTLEFLGSLPVKESAGAWMIGSGAFCVAISVAVLDPRCLNFFQFAYHFRSEPQSFSTCEGPNLQLKGSADAQA